jgi:hypothetical protein
VAARHRHVRGGIRVDGVNWDSTESAEPSGPICSAKGCRAPAAWVLAWNNPKLHTPERRKTWLACDEHRESLSAFLDVRSFLQEVAALGDWQARESGTGGA